jgi:hypothetical protein
METPDQPFNIQPSPRKKYLRIITWIALVLSLIVFFLMSTQLVSEKQLLLDDYAMYWAAARLNLQNGNPYSLDELLPMQIAAGRTENVPVMFWNPPWTLAITMPLALLPYPPSRVLWYLLHLGIVIAASHWAWQQYAGPRRWHWVAWGVGLIFGPTLDVMKAGQISALLLLGAVGFVFLQQKNKGFLAGMLLALIAIKPHTLYLIGLAVIFWSLANRKWAVLAGGATALGAALGISWLVNPLLIQQYLYASTNYPPTQWATATLGAELRMLFGPEHFWLQFVPPAIGGIGFCYYWLRKRQTWDWIEQFPRLLVVSTATAAYGWTFDNTAVIVAVVQIAAMLFTRGSWRLKGIILLTYLGLDAILILVSIPQMYFWWAPAALALWYLISSQALSRSKVNTPVLKNLELAHANPST